MKIFLFVVIALTFFLLTARVPVVRQAQKVKGLYIVSFDWLEDSLMKSWPRKEANYVLERQVRAAKKSKKEKKAVKKENIRNGRKFYPPPSSPFRPAKKASRLNSESLRKVLRDL